MSFGYRTLAIAPMHGGILQMQDDVVASRTAASQRTALNAFRGNKFRHREGFAGSTGASQLHRGIAAVATSAVCQKMCEIPLKFRDDAGLSRRSPNLVVPITCAPRRQNIFEP